MVAQSGAKIASNCGITDVGRLGRQPNASYRSVEDGSLPLVDQSGAKIASNRAITDVGRVGTGCEKMTTIKGVHGVLLFSIVTTVRLVAANACPCGFSKVIFSVYGFVS